MRDRLKDIITWATDGIHGFFGESGKNLASNETMNLWFQLVTPWFIRIDGGHIADFTLIVELEAKYYLP